MSYLPSYYALSNAHKSFVQAYLRCGNDPTKACQFLHPDDDYKTNRQRGYDLMRREDIQNAINDKLSIQEDKLTITRNDAIRMIMELYKSADDIDNASKKISVKKFKLACISEFNKIAGFHHLNINVQEKQDIKISLVGIRKPEAPATPIQDAQVIPDEQVPTNQLDISFPPADPVRYTLEDLDDISEELPPEDPDLPEDLP